MTLLDSPPVRTLGAHASGVADDRFRLRNVVFEIEL